MPSSNPSGGEIRRRVEGRLCRNQVAFLSRKKGGHMIARLLMGGLLAAAMALPHSDAAAQAKDNKQAKRAEVHKMASDTLAQLYKASPSAKDRIEKAAGYGVFSNFGLTIVFVGGAGGKGLVHDNASKKDTYMEMGQAQVGSGI